jgi:trk system potassium uptake protein TrkA
MEGQHGFSLAGFIDWATGADVSLPKIPGAHIGAIVRRGKDADVVQREGFLMDEVRHRVIIPHHYTVIEPDDHVIVLCMRKRQGAEVEKHFQVSVGFL